MASKRYTLLYYIVAVLLLTACNKRTEYFHYESTPEGGWERNEHLSFTIDDISTDGTYEETLGLRTSGNYPYRNVQLIVTQSISPIGKTFSDTVSCMLIDERGITLGDGVTHYQYTFPIRHLTLSAGQSVAVSIRHDMMREVLPGITDVGIRLERH